MPELLLKLKQVPEDEYHQVVEILDTHNIEYYETNAGFWGLGMAAIWLNDSAQYTQACELLNDYYKARQLSAREDYQQAKADGTLRTLWSTFQRQPGYFVLYVAIIVGLIALTISPFLALVP
ncbi:hypothetical protein A9Q73_02185 [Bermanella sp. 47_1433_sub80_T6]|nr:hypothetical protein A9Q73_02185 [Bermanella sp. 47_1433_sub80_T6]